MQLKSFTNESGGFDRQLIRRMVSQGDLLAQFEQVYEAARQEVEG
jgi:hypothetical protein